MTIISRKKRNKIWNINKEELSNVVQKANSLHSILKHFELDVRPGNYKILKSRLTFDNIDFSHISLGINSNKGRNFGPHPKKIPLDKILIENSNYNRGKLKKRLFKEGLLEEKCYECGLSSIWNNKPISLQLDHINGISDDNRIENLRILCPNCHSQTSTFAGKRLKKS